MRVRYDDEVMRRPDVVLLVPSNKRSPRWLRAKLLWKQSAKPPGPQGGWPLPASVPATRQVSESCCSASGSFQVKSLKTPARWQHGPVPLQQVWGW